MAGAGDVFDVCVIGAGVEGSSTARYLASRGKRALLLEQVRVILPQRIITGCIIGVVLQSLAVSFTC